MRSRPGSGARNCTECFFAQCAVFGGYIDRAVTVDLAPSLRARKKAATRRAIHEAAFDLVDANGLSKVTVEAISERADVAPRTFWSYFSSKEDAVLDRDPERPEALRLALLARPADEDALTALRRVLEEDLEARVLDRDMAVRRAALIRREPHLMAAVAATFDELERALVSAVAERLGKDTDSDLSPGVIVSAAIGACKVAATLWSERRRKGELRDMIDEAFERLAEGLANYKLESTAR
jgi:AcrR family transcriptional regulator